MTVAEISPEKREELFNKWLVAEYLKYGSVDEVYRVHKYDIPISYPSFQRLLTSWGIVKAAGPNSKLSEAIEFLAHLAEAQIPLERLYKKMPPSFQTSMATMHRILQHVKEGVTRRVGTALVITPENNPNLFLIGSDISTPRLELGKPYGSLSLPMGFSRKRDSRRTNILRVLQQEVYTKDAIERNTPKEFLSHPEPFMYLDIADVRVSVYHFSLPEKLAHTRNFSSFKLSDFRYIHLADILNGKQTQLRSGITELASGYIQAKQESVTTTFAEPLYLRSKLNEALLSVSTE